MLYAVLEEAEGAIVKVEQHAHTITLHVAACSIGVLLAIAEESSVGSIDEPGFGTVTKSLR
jgi:hypothetical protein